MEGDRERVLQYLSKDASLLAAGLVDRNPWLCNQLDVDLATWSRPILEGQGLKKATLRIMGSAATGFSLAPEKAGRPFRTISGMDRPSDLDFAIVDEKFFTGCWNEMVGSERHGGGPCHPNRDYKMHVYWGRIDDYYIPYRTRPKIVLRQLLGEIGRSPEFRGYPASIRIYRRREDLLECVLSGIRFLRRKLT